MFGDFAMVAFAGWLAFALCLGYQLGRNDRRHV